MSKFQFPTGEVKHSITKETVKWAEEFGHYLATDDSSQDGLRPMTTSQLRRFFGEVKRQQVNGYNQSDFVLLKPKLAYAVGRDKKKEKDGMRNTTKIGDFYDVMSQGMSLVTNKEEFDRFVKVFEAVVAFHKEKSTDK